jgi:D-glycero-alpha-D-manno-heptose-7-phosphate kinase
MLFFTGLTRTASEIAGEQIKQSPKKKDELMHMMGMVDEAIDILHDGDIREFGSLLHKSWLIKRKLTSLITNERIDSVYDSAMKAGAIGGKLIGAGSGGFMLFFVEPEKQKKVQKALNELLYVPFKFSRSGSQIIYYTVDE